MVKYREVIKLIEIDGWYLHSTVGSHQQYKHPVKPGRVTIAGKARQGCTRRHAEEYSAAIRLN